MRKENSHLIFHSGCKIRCPILLNRMNMLNKSISQLKGIVKSKKRKPVTLGKMKKSIRDSVKKSMLRSV